MKLRFVIALAGLSISVPGTAANTELKREYSAKELARMQSLTPDHFRQTATIVDDALEPIATITTDRGFSSMQRFAITSSGGTSSARPCCWAVIPRQFR